MKRNLLGWCALAVALGGCGKHAAQAGDKQAGNKQAGNSGPVNTMSCTIDGATTFSASGEKVSVGSLGGDAATVSLGLGMHADSIGRTHAISTGLLTVPTAPGSYEFPKPGTPGMSPADYRIRNDANETLEDYTGAGYSQFYALSEQDPQARLVLDITRFDKLPAKTPNTQRVRLAGTFRFNAAYAPYVNGNLPDACTIEAIQRAMTSQGKPGAYPRFNPALCAAKKHRVECKFDVTENLIQL